LDDAGRLGLGAGDEAFGGIGGGMVLWAIGFLMWPHGWPCQRRCLLVDQVGANSVAERGRQQCDGLLALLRRIRAPGLRGSGREPSSRHSIG
jgi:hypothetical protein